MTREIRYFQSYLATNKNLSNNTISAYTTDILQLENYLNLNKLTLLNATTNDVINYFSNILIHLLLS